ncbi:KamA family radical SAM protein [Actinoallomurus soli]|uniref:KamA family radical SAM protein n=1 Tax=Actinoallomurus soli TaxID=2952535 RepID=UPI002091FA9E|nr:lysine 2,3-aminomutase [Actinoallomurus soli]MCO5972278.1 lysine 2,3-aminomutase [Actinoallomurus soli]
MQEFILEDTVTAVAEESVPAPGAHPQPYAYRHRELAEPDWRRFPGWRDVTAAEWESAQWQRAHCVKNVRQLRQVMGDLLSEDFYADLERDQRERATMSMLVPPQMLNTMDVSSTAAFHADPVRRYMLPVFSDRRTDWPSHPVASRDSLHEAEMWAAEGLTHRYPTKVLAELLPTCPQYCGHCTRMDLVGNSTPQIDKHKFTLKQPDRVQAMLDYLRHTPQVRDVVVSGGDVANMPWPRLEAFVDQLLDIDNIRDIRLATKALMGLPQHWLQDDVRAGVERLATKARARGAQLAVHTHVNAAQSMTPLVAKAARAMLDAGVRDVRNQGVLLRGVNTTVEQLLDLCFALQDNGVLPYYFYLCDMIPFSEHWRLSLGEAQRLQHGIMGYLPGFATPRIVCDVPYVGKRWVHQVAEYDTERGISYWTKNYRTALESDDPDALNRRYEYYDPIHTLPEEGRAWWREHAAEVPGRAADLAAASRNASEALLTE